MSDDDSHTEEGTPAIQQQHPNRGIISWFFPSTAREDSDNYSITSSISLTTGETICQAALCCSIFIGGIVLLVLALFPILPMSSTTTTYTLDASNKRLSVFDSYWVESVDIHLFSGERLDLSYLHTKPVVNTTVSFQKKIYPYYKPSDIRTWGHQSYHLFAGSFIEIEWNFTADNAPANLWIVKSQQAFELWEAWGIIEHENLLSTHISTHKGTSGPIPIMMEEDYYIIYALSRRNDGEPLVGEIDINIKSRTYASTEIYCSLSPHNRDCNIPLSGSSYILFSTLASDNPYTFSTTTQPRSNIFTKYWYLWVIIGIITILIIILFIILCIGFTCHGCAWILTYCFPSLFDEGDDEERQGLLDYTGYGVYEGEPLPLYIGPPKYDDEEVRDRRSPLVSSGSVRSFKSVSSSRSSPPAYD